MCRVSKGVHKFYKCTQKKSSQIAREANDEADRFFISMQGNASRSIAEGIVEEECSRCRRTVLDCHQ